MSQQEYYGAPQSPPYPQHPPNAYGGGGDKGPQQYGYGGQSPMMSQNGYYPQQPQMGYGQAQMGYGGQQGYYGPPQAGYYSQPPIIVQQPHNYNRGGYQDGDCCACLAGLLACFCLADLCLF